MQRVVGIIEAEHSLQVAGLLGAGIKALEQACCQPVLRLNDLLQPHKPRYFKHLDCFQIP